MIQSSDSSFRVTSLGPGRIYRAPGDFIKPQTSNLQTHTAPPNPSVLPPSAPRPISNAPNCCKYQKNVNMGHCHSWRKKKTQGINEFTPMWAESKADIPSARVVSCDRGRWAGWEMGFLQKEEKNADNKMSGEDGGRERQTLVEQNLFSAWATWQMRSCSFLISGEWNSGEFQRSLQIQLLPFWELWWTGVTWWSPHCWGRRKKTSITPFGPSKTLNPACFECVYLGLNKQLCPSTAALGG